MPSWGPIFYEVESAQDWGEVRLDAFTKYLESIRQKLGAHLAPTDQDCREGARNHTKRYSAEQWNEPSVTRSTVASSSLSPSQSYDS
jgi:hypothetical protein